MALTQRKAIYCAALAAAAGGAAGAHHLKTPSAAAHGPSSVLTIRTTDFAFQAADRLSMGRVTLLLRNEGLVPHEARLVRFEDGHTLRDLEREVSGLAPTLPLSLPAWVTEVGTLGAVAPGGEGRTTLSLRRGHHAILCLMPLTDGSAALMKGMYHALEVVESPSGSAPGLD